MHSYRMATSLAVVITMLFGISSVSTGTDLKAPLIFVEDFESGKIDFGSAFTQSGNAPTITSEVARAGKFAMKSYLNRAESPVSKRTEVSVKAPLTHIGDELWYGFSIFLPKSFVPGSVWEIVAQWHNTPNDWNDLFARQNPPLTLSTRKSDVPPGHWLVNAVWDADPVAPNGSFKIDGSKTWDLGAWATNEWTDWVFHIKWSYSADGILQVWKNGEMVIDYAGPNTYNDKIGPYFKMGIYKGWKDRVTPYDNVSERVVYHDELRIAEGQAAKYSDVAPPGPRKATVLSMPMPPSSVVVQ